MNRRIDIEVGSHDSDGMQDGVVRRAGLLLLLLQTVAE
jgi:hypothetical protein